MGLGCGVPHLVDLRVPLPAPDLEDALPLGQFQKDELLSRLGGQVDRDLVTLISGSAPIALPKRDRRKLVGLPHPLPTWWHASPLARANPCSDRTAIETAVLLHCEIIVRGKQHGL